MTIKFKKPPINEVIISTYFNPPLHGLRSEHIGLFWHSIKENFPNVSQQAPAGGMDITMGSEIFPMPRYWMIAADDINLIQIQKNAFMFNWRHRDDEYPHYENLKSVFDKYYSKFQDFILSETETERLQIDVCELVYINTIESCDYWSGPGDTKNVIPSFSIPTIGMSPEVEPEYHCAFVYVIADDLQLRVTVRNAQSAQNSEVPVLVFEIRASERIGSANKSVADSWFDRSHQAIIDCFVGMTNPEIQNKYWIPKESSA
jgi:uncharacterized protein (TIGR04255 family)